MKSLSAVISASVLIFLSGNSYGREDPPEITPLTLMDKGFLIRHRDFVDELGRTEFGTHLRNNKTDLQLLKRILEGRYINQTEPAKFHSLGVVLGDVYVSELGLEWVIYEDKHGISHAVCAPKTSQCLFPVTTISKRGTKGVIPDVIKLYNRGVELIEDELPKLPYAVKKPPKQEGYGRTYRIK